MTKLLENVRWLKRLQLQVMLLLNMVISKQIQKNSINVVKNRQKGRWFAKIFDIQGKNRITKKQRNKTDQKLESWTWDKGLVHQMC